MTDKDKSILFWLVGVIVLSLVTVLFRLIPHPPHWVATLGGALFLGWQFRSLSNASSSVVSWATKFSWFLAASFIFLTSLALSDAWLGFYPGFWLIYMCYIPLILLGFSQTFMTLGRNVILSLSAAIWFFASSNFIVWMQGVLYPKTWSGLVEAYVMALPFFHQTLISTALTGVCLYGVAKVRYPRSLHQLARADQ